MLLPALNKARESAKSVACLSNLRQSGAAMLMYQNDNKGSYPMHSTAVGYWITPAYTGWHVNWPRMMWALGYVKSPEVYHCPSQPIDPFGNRDLTPYRTGDEADFGGDPFDYIDYGYNYRNLGSGGYFAFYATPSYLTQSQPAHSWDVKHPEETIVLCDSVFYALSADGLRGYYVVADSFLPVQNSNYNADARHSGSCNVLWADGHASSVICPKGSPYGNNDGKGLTNFYDAPNHWTRNGKSFGQIYYNQ
jgi:prepilin-type processing-associated H-X9-DG protein